MSNDNEQNAPDSRPAVGVPVERMVGRPAPERATLKLAPDVVEFYADDLLGRMVSVLAAQHRRKRNKAWPFWAYVREATALGSNCSAGLARWAGFDPDTAQPLVDGRKPPNAMVSGPL